MEMSLLTWGPAKPLILVSYHPCLWSWAGFQNQMDWHGCGISWWGLNPACTWRVWLLQLFPTDWGASRWSRGSWVTKRTPWWTFPRWVAESKDPIKGPQMLAFHLLRCGCEEVAVAKLDRGGPGKLRPLPPSLKNNLSSSSWHLQATAVCYWLWKPGMCFFNSIAQVRLCWELIDWPAKSV